MIRGGFNTVDGVPGAKRSVPQRETCWGFPSVQPKAPRGHFNFGTAFSEIFAVLAVAVLPSVIRAAEQPVAVASENVYLAPKSLSRAQLAGFIAEMQAKPESVRKRPGFNEAIVEAADRVLAVSVADDEGAAALLAKFTALHAMSLAGIAAADEQLFSMAESLRKDKRPPIKREARFHLLEWRTRQVDELDQVELARLLEHVQKFFSSETPQRHHLRLASGTVAAINRLKDDRAASDALRRFGDLFAKSLDPQLAQYGRKVLKAGTPKPAKTSKKP